MEIAIAWQDVMDLEEVVRWDAKNLADRAETRLWVLPAISIGTGA